MQNSPLKTMIGALASELLSGVRLIEEIDDEAFIRTSVRSGSIGAQFRHNLDFVNSFLSGIACGRIDYEKRERDPRVETDRGYAAAKFRAAVVRLRRLETLSVTDERSFVLVRSEIDTLVLHSSTLTRELEFLLSHTIHHHALIGEKLEAAGVNVRRDFGVAPSTLKFWRSERINSLAA